MEENTPKKICFDDLSREDLVKKCKSLLIIAQKAKQSKSDIASQYDALKETCQKLEMQKAADKQSLQTMQECVDKLTEQKLNHTIELDSLQSQYSKQIKLFNELQNELQNLSVKSEEKIGNLSRELQNVKENLTTIDIENTSLKRQNTRLQNENETLINQLDELEKQIDTMKKLGLKQQQELLSLEKNTNNFSDSASELINDSSCDTSLKNSLIDESEANKKCDAFQKVIDEKCQYIINIEKEINELKTHITTVKKEHNSEKGKKEKLNQKLKLYKDKLIKCNSSISQLKNSKLVLLKTISDYSENVKKWQRDILNASKLLSDHLLRLESENSELKNKCQILEVDLNKNEKNSEISDQNTSLQMKLEFALSDVQRLEELNTIHMNDLEARKSEIDLLIDSIKTLENEKNTFINEKQVAMETIQKIEMEKMEMQDTHKELNDSKNLLKSEVSKLNKSINILENEKRSLLEKMEGLSKCINSDQSAVETMKEEISLLKTALVSVEEENKLLIESNENFRCQLESVSEGQSTPEMYNMLEQNDLLQAEISRLQAKITTIKNENVSLHNEVKDVRHQLSNLEGLLQDYESMKAKFSTYKTENIELLKEMKEINQALKERGETISKQYMEISELQRKLQQSEDETKETKECIDEKDKEMKKLNEELSHSNQSLVLEKENLEALLKERDGIIISLQEDIEKLKQNQGNVLFDTRSDSMSVSTLSRVDEVSRLKDVEESLEERYSKLRMLAIKLKKRISELTLHNKDLEEANNKISQEKFEILAKLQELGCTAKNMHIMQTEYDKVSDELERKNTETKNNDVVYQELKKESDKLLSDLKIANLKIDDLSKALDSYKIEKTAMDVVVKELNSQIVLLKKEIEESKKKDSEYSKMKDTLALKESQLVLEQSQHQITKDELEKMRKEVKKKSVLSLEMEDYERSMKELTNKMEEDKKKIIQMESTIDTQQATILSLKTQMKMLEDQLSSEEKSSKEIKDLLQKSTESLKEKESIINSKVEMISQLERIVENSKLQNEDYNLQLASVLAEKEKFTLSFEKEKSELITKIKLYENKCNDMEEKLKLKCTELEDIKSDFTGYKLRAQSVLRQNIAKDLNIEENLKEDMAALKGELDSLQLETETLKSDLETLQSEHCRVLNRCGELQSALNTAQAERDNIAEQYSLSLQKEVQDQRNIKLQMATLTQCYKKQIEELEKSTSEQIMKLKKELDFAKTSISQNNSMLRSTNESKKSLNFMDAENAENADSSAQQSLFVTIPEEINVSLLKREEGEGSESTRSPSPTYTRRISLNLSSKRGKREPMPLDQLLESEITEDGPDSYTDCNIEEQLSNALKQIEIRDRRLGHLTELVAESEKEVARRSQLIETLKEEVRRCQRALDRGLHHHNQEYLKNVIIKFLTLNAGDERSRLVPVLNTILTLSPEETQQLNAMAKGLDPNSNKGWSSYLWSSAK